MVEASASVKETLPERFQMAAKPLLKWAGAKNWLAPSLAPVIASYLDRTGGYYVDPFLGGGAVPLALGRRSFLSDIVSPLVEFYEALRDDPGGLAWNLSSLAILGVDEESYYRVRDMRPDKAVGRAARVLYLNRIGYNGLWRENRRGEYNVPYGDAVYRKSSIGRSARDAIESLFPNREKIEHASRALRQSEFWTGDFGDPVACAGPGDFVFADSPYDGTFNSYSKDKFSSEDQVRLANGLRLATERGAAFVACNADTELIRREYEEWCDVVSVREQRRITNTSVASRPRSSCLLLIGGSKEFRWAAGNLEMNLKDSSRRRKGEENV